MKKQVYNPFLPLDEYIPDGEPHVFGDRVYLYGSHDQAGASRFCVQDYTVWSAPVDDLSDWRNHGVTYRKEQDARAVAGGLPDFYAPDCVKGNDGRYYLYYVAMGPNVHPFGPMSVAVSVFPAGPFQYLGDIRNPDGTPLLMYLTNDPAVINDNGKIRLYYGWSINRDFRSKLLDPIFTLVQSQLFRRSVAEIKKTKPSINGCAYVELQDDMLTVVDKPKLVLDSLTTAHKGTPQYEHPFYEAASIRKFDDLYYLVYSSGHNNELAYATSTYPDRDFIYRGVIISNADLGLSGNTIPKAPAGTIHGGIELINGRYYIFYHRCTHGTDFSRQACAEPIEIMSDGTIRQVEITSCGLNDKPLCGEGNYPAAICCNLYTGSRMPLSRKRTRKIPQIIEKDGKQIITNIVNGTTVGYKYFNLSENSGLTVKIQGAASGLLEVRGKENGAILGCVPVKPREGWDKFRTRLTNQAGKSALFFTFRGIGKLELQEISLGEYVHENHD